MNFYDYLKVTIGTKLFYMPNWQKMLLFFGFYFILLNLYSFEMADCMMKAPNTSSQYLAAKRELTTLADAALAQDKSKPFLQTTDNFDVTALHTYESLGQIVHQFIQAADARVAELNVLIEKEHPRLPSHLGNTDRYLHPHMFLDTPDGSTDSLETLKQVATRLKNSPEFYANSYSFYDPTEIGYTHVINPKAVAAGIHKHVCALESTLNSGAQPVIESTIPVIAEAKTVFNSGLAVKQSLVESIDYIESLEKTVMEQKRTISEQEQRIFDVESQIFKSSRTR